MQCLWPLKTNGLLLCTILALNCACEWQDLKARRVKYFFVLLSLIALVSSLIYVVDRLENAKKNNAKYTKLSDSGSVSEDLDGNGGDDDEKNLKRNNFKGGRVLKGQDSDGDDDDDTDRLAKLGIKIPSGNSNTHDDAKPRVNRKNADENSDDDAGNTSENIVGKF